MTKLRRIDCFICLPLVLKYLVPKISEFGPCLRYTEIGVLPREGSFQLFESYTCKFVTFTCSSFKLRCVAKAGRLQRLEGSTGDRGLCLCVADVRSCVRLRWGPAGTDPRGQCAGAGGGTRASSREDRPGPSGRRHGGWGRRLER